MATTEDIAGWVTELAADMKRHVPEDEHIQIDLLAKIVSTMLTDLHRIANAVG